MKMKSNKQIQTDRLPKVVLGKRQVTKEAKAGRLKEIWLATDADENYKKEIKMLAKEKKIKIFSNNTAQEFAKKYQLDVKCGVVGLINEIEGN